MTRETKIGLLVGLAFIIVIGILLSDHMASTTDPPQARLDKSADGVRSSIATPNSGEPPITVVNMNGGGATPSQPIPTKRELVAQQTPVMAATVPTTGGAGTAIAQTDTTETPKAPIVIRDSRPSANGQSHESTPVEEITNVTPEGDPLDNWINDAKKKGVEIVPVKPRGSTPTANSGGGKLVEYKAEPGDNLSKLAIKLMGGNSKANRDAIVAANPSLKDNPNMIVVGKKYQIPAPASEKAEAPRAESPAARSEAPIKPATAEKQVVEPRTGGQSIYVVKENDTLWKIASRELGSGAAWTQIKELNQDVLKGNDQVVANMKLRMPAKPMTAASAD